SKLYIDCERHEFHFRLDSELEWNGADYDVCFFHATHSHGASFTDCRCWHGLDHCCYPVRGNIEFANVYGHQHARDHKPAHGVWDGRGCLLLYNYSNQQPNQLYCKPTARWTDCQYEHGRDFGNTHNKRDN